MIVIRTATLAVIFAALTAGARHAGANTFQVTNFSDAVPAPVNSFRAALEASNATPLTAAAPHRIEFVTVGAGTIRPVAPFTIQRAVRIAGNNKVTFDSTTAASGAIDGHTVFVVPRSQHLEMWETNLFGRGRQRAIYVAPAGFLETETVRISGFKDPEGYAPGYGGGVMCEGDGPGTPFGEMTTYCALRRTRIDNCAAEFGGGVAGNGAVSLSLTWSDVDANVAHSDGGGILAYGTETSDYESALDISKTSIRNNTTLYNGGAVAAVGLSSARIVNSTVAHNATSTAHQAASLLLDTIPDLRVLHSTIVDGAGPAGGVSNGNALQIARATGYVRNSIIGQTGNPRGDLCALGPSNAVAFGNDIVQDTSCGPAATATLGLLALQASACGIYAPATLGGCMVHPLQSTSPARNFAAAAYCTAGHGTLWDQREYIRPGTCDAGAYEYDGVP